MPRNSYYLMRHGMTDPPMGEYNYSNREIIISHDMPLRVLGAIARDQAAIDLANSPSFQPAEIRLLL